MGGHDRSRGKRAAARKSRGARVTAVGPVLAFIRGSTFSGAAGGMGTANERACGRDAFPAEHPMRREAVRSLGLWVSGNSGLRRGGRGGGEFQPRDPEAQRPRETSLRVRASPPHAVSPMRLRHGKEYIETTARFDGWP